MENISEGRSWGAGGGHTLLGFGCGCSSVYLSTASLLLNLRHFKHIFL